MLIKIIAGGYGLNDGKRTKLKDKLSPPFCVEPEEAHRLVSLGIAEIVEDESSDNALTLNSTRAENSDMDLSEMSVSELRRIAKAYGITFKVGTTKEDMIETITEYIEDEMPALSAAMPI